MFKRLEEAKNDPNHRYWVVKVWSVRFDKKIMEEEIND